MTPGRQRSTSTTCATSSGLKRRRPARIMRRNARHAARVQGVGRAGVPRRQASREQLEHLEDRRGDRHAAQQSVQEARAVRDHAGNGRIDTAAADQTIAPRLQARSARSSRYEGCVPSPEGEAGGKSELRRAVRRVTPGQGNLKESGTENIPPDVRAAGNARERRGKGEKVR